MKYTVIDDQTGRVVKSGSSSTEEGCLLQAGPGQSVILGVAHPDDVAIIDGEAVPVAPSADELAAIKVALKNRVDTMAGSVRSSIITLAAGQDYVYARKLAEAEKVIGQAALAAEVPLVAAEAEADGMALAAKASQIVAASQASSSALAAIEVKRRAAKAAIDAAATKAEAEAAAAVNW